MSDGGETWKPGKVRPPQELYQTRSSLIALSSTMGRILGPDPRRVSFMAGLSGGGSWWLAVEALSGTAVGLPIGASTSFITVEFNRVGSCLCGEWYATDGIGTGFLYVVETLAVP